MNSQQLHEHAMKRVELVCWSGSVECLAFKLGVPTDALLTALTAVGRDLRRSPIRLEVDILNQAHVLSAARRAISAASACADERPDLLEHPLRV